MGMSKELSLKKLWHRWILSFIVLGVILRTLDYYGYQLGPVKVRHIINWLITSFYLYPLMFTIKSRAKEEGASKILICSKWLIFVMSVWVTLATIAMVYFLLVGLSSLL